MPGSSDLKTAATEQTGLRLPGMVADLALPRYCPVCRATDLVPGRPWCAACDRRIQPIARAICPECRAFREAGFGDCPSGHTAAQPAFVCVVGSYDAAFGNIVGALKYDGCRWLARPLAGLMLEAMPSWQDIDLVAAVPTSRRKMKRLGFGHAEEIAGHLADLTALPFRSDTIVQTRRIADQTRLNASERLANLDGAFRVNEPGLVRGRTVWVVDDVMTTGATLGEAARALVNAGARAVCAAVVGINLGEIAGGIR